MSETKLVFGTISGNLFLVVAILCGVSASDAKINPPEIGFGVHMTSMQSNYTLNSRGFGVYVWEQVTEKTAFRLSITTYQHNTGFRSVDYFFNMHSYGATTNSFRSVELIGMTNIFQRGRASLDLGAGPTVLASKEVTRAVNGLMIFDGGWGLTTGIAANAILAILDVGNLPVVLRLNLGVQYTINPFPKSKMALGAPASSSQSSGYFEFFSSSSHDSVAAAVIGVSLGYDFGRKKIR